MKSENVQLASSLMKSNLNMAVGVGHFVTVTACNKVGLCAKTSSDGFIIDDTPPNMLTKPFIYNLHMETYRKKTLISDPSYLKIMWKFEDKESPIVRTLISIFSNLDSHVPVDDIIISYANEYTICLSRNDSLRLGDVYTVKVTACNAADLCTTSYSDKFIVDWTPPQMGGFKFPLKYKRINGSITLSLSWYGFFDAQSGIRFHHISIGTTYSNADIIEDFLVIPKQINDTDNAEIPTNKGDLPEKIVLTIWAVNDAGLASPESKVTVDVVPLAYDKSKGELIIQKHSCSMEFCNVGCTFCHCTCGVVGKKCVSKEKDDCNAISSKQDMLQQLHLNISLRSDDRWKKATGSSLCLYSSWIYQNKSFSFQRFEYSFGRNDSGVGEGIYNMSIEDPWHDVGKRQHAFYCLQDGELSHGSYYIAYVRTWISQEKFFIATSLPIIVDHTPPFIHKRHSITDSSEPCGKDVDYISSPGNMYGCWNGVFSDDESGILEFIVSLGTSKGGLQQII